MRSAWLIAILLIGLIDPSRARAAVPIPIDLFRETEPRVMRTQIQSESNPSIQRWIHFFSVDDRARFDRFMRRGALYRTMIQDVLLENDVPSEMYYLAMIESGFARGAKSTAHAVGVWQFGSATARLYGLRVDREVDERMDIIRSTRAAAHLLKDLHNEFGSWYMAMAAYNCGVGCIRKAVRRGGTYDFWRLSRRGLLPDETVNYVPKFQAAMTIAREPQRFGFRPKRSYEFPVVKRVRVPGRVRVSEIARKHRVSIESLISLNPNLLAGQTPNSRRGYEVWIPLAK